MLRVAPHMISPKVMAEIRRYLVRLVTRHFFGVNHNVSDLRWQVVEEVEGDDAQQILIHLHQRETYWIFTLELLAPKGLKEYCNWSGALCTKCQISEDQYARAGQIQKSAGMLGTKWVRPCISLHMYKGSEINSWK